MRKFLLSLMLALALAIGSTAGGAAANAAATPPAGSYTDGVAGIETGVPTGPSMFAGLASGSLPGVWTASVFHNGVPGTITGGSFTLNSLAGVVSGSFDDGGSIALVRGTCTQTFLVRDTLTLAHGSGSFDAYLTHYGYTLGGRCHIFFATVHGLVTLNLS